MSTIIGLVSTFRLPLQMFAIRFDTSNQIYPIALVTSAITAYLLSIFLL